MLFKSTFCQKCSEHVASELCQKTEEQKKVSPSHVCIGLESQLSTTHFPTLLCFDGAGNSSLWLMKESIKQVHCLAFKWDLTELEQGAVGLLTAGSTSMLGL